MKKTITILSIFSVFLIHAQSDNGNIDLGPGNLIVPKDDNGDAYPEASVIDGVFQKKDMLSKRRPVPYEHVREADYVWGKRTWSYIDLREKINHPFFLPREETDSEDIKIIKQTSQGRYSLYLILRTAMLNGEITGYFDSKEKTIDNPEGAFGGDAFVYPAQRDYSKTVQEDKRYKKDIDLLCGDSDLEPFEDFYTEEAEEYWYRTEEAVKKFENGFDKVSMDLITSDYDEAWKNDDGQAEIVESRDTTTIVYTPDQIIKYVIKEDWYFDKERSVMKPRIIGLGPVIMKEGEGGPKEKILFWVYFPQARQVLKNYYTYNPKNDAQWMSFDDLFWKRKFNAIIYKQSNTFDRKIEQYRFGADALYESKKIKDKMRDFEHDVWNF